MSMELISKVGTIASFLLPLFNIPLILRIAKRKSSDDISVVWVVGVWICILLMTPAAIRSSDTTFKVFGVMNVIFFSLVAFFSLKYRFLRKP